jgi:hypothetical protein
VVDRLPAMGPGLLFHTSQSTGVSGKLSVPVSPQSEVYARFRHVVGVSAEDGAQPVPILKLRILDNLIDRYVASRKGLEDVVVDVNPRTVDTVIAALSADVHEELAARAMQPGQISPEPGAVLSLGV